MSRPTSRLELLEGNLEPGLLRELERGHVHDIVTGAVEEGQRGGLVWLIWTLLEELRRLDRELRELRVGDVGGDR